MSTAFGSHDTCPRLRLRISAAAEAILRSGHPWLFGDSITESNRAGQMGDLAIIYDRRDRFLALGLFDPDSPLRVRVLHRGKPQPVDHAWWARRLSQALDRRSGLFDQKTTGFRWINGESDGWPGLVLDCYDTTLVLKLYTAAWLPWLDLILEVIRERLTPTRLVLRLSRNIQAGASQHFSKIDRQILWGPPVEGPVCFRETGLRFEADVLRGQKTGFFLDQRENRRRVEALASGRRVLNAFSFSGAFSVYAARGGACSTTDLDISAHALVAARRNFELNQQVGSVQACRHETVQADSFDWLAGNSDRLFDLIILDPPSLARREAERAGAVRAYTKLATLGLSHLAAPGILMACSCSAHVSTAEFFGAIRQAAVQSGRPFEELETAGHAPDHPVGFAEAQYLKAIYLKFKTPC